MSSTFDINTNVTVGRFIGPKINNDRTLWIVTNPHGYQVEMNHSDLAALRDWITQELKELHQE